MKQIMAVQYSRKRNKRTDYRKRLKLISSGKERLVVRRTSSHVIVQIIKFDEKGDKVIISTQSGQLKKYGWQLGSKNIPAAYLTGLLAGKLATAKGVKTAVLDTGTSKPVSKGRVYAAMKGAIDAGLEVPAADTIFPSEDRISGKHLSSDKAASMFTDTKAKISGGKNE